MLHGEAYAVPAEGFVLSVLCLSFVSGGIIKIWPISTFFFYFIRPKCVQVGRLGYALFITFASVACLLSVYFRRGYYFVVGLRFIFFKYFQLNIVIDILTGKGRLEWGG